VIPSRKGATEVFSCTEDEKYHNLKRPKFQKANSYNTAFPSAKKRNEGSNFQNIGSPRIQPNMCTPTLMQRYLN